MVQTPIEGFRLSPQQRRVWLFQQATGQHTLYAHGVLTIEGPLDHEVVIAALHTVVQRHEVLRTTFHLVPEIQFPLQVIADALLPAMQNYDLSSLTPEEQEARVEALVLAPPPPVDLAQGPLLQATLIRLAQTRHLLLLQIPALCGDAAALRLLGQELHAVYAAMRADTPQPDDPPQYVDLASWLNELIESDETAAGRSFWQRQDLSALRTLALPFVQPGDAAAFVPGQIRWSVPPEIAAQIETLCQQTTAADAFFLACWQLLLSRYSGQAELVVAVEFAGRKYEELTQALGLFATFLPIHSQLDAHLRFHELVDQTQQAMQTANEWQEYFAWDYLPDALSASGAPRSLPFGFAFTPSSAPRHAAHLTMRLERQTVYSEPFALLLSCAARDTTFDLTLHYDTARCPADDVVALVRALQTVIGHVLMHPSATLARYALVDAIEQRRLLALVNTTRPVAPPADCFHLRFTAQAQRTPDRIAVIDEHARISYDELDRRTNQLASYLQTLGVGPETCVALCVERSLDFVIALLGVLKAGGAYVPLDPALPSERLSFMLADLQAPVLLTQQAMLAQLPASDAVQLCLDRDWPLIAAAAHTSPQHAISPTNLAYVIYTSGSTGVPKGVAVEHRQLCAYLDAILLRLALPEPASFALVSTVAADLGNTSIFPALATGGCLHTISAARTGDPAALADYFRRHPIDCLKIVPSHLRAMLAGAEATDLLPRQRLILGGEAASWAWVQELQALLPPDAQILNHYGPTETTVGVLTLPFDPEQPPTSTTLPLGRPLVSAQAYVLDEQLQPVPAWVPGELYIGGVTVTRGYLHRPALTAERFVPDPFAQGATAPHGARLYRTGDRARLLPNGTIAFLGRTDDQIKLRGFRVEPGEIEALLNAHPAVQAAAVLVREDTPGDQRLVAYVAGAAPGTRSQEPKEQSTENRQQGDAGIREPGSGLPAASPPPLVPSVLRDYLAAKLPEYMVPAVFVQLDALPVTANGKLDRQALPAPLPAAQTRAIVTPRTPEEELLAELWRHVLGVQQVSRDDNFFALGGHSLLATQLITRIRGAFQVELPLRTLFETPVLAEMATHLTAVRAAGALPAATAIQSAPRSGPLPLSLAQQGLWFIAQLAPESGAYTMSMPLRVTGPFDRSAAQQALDALVQRHETLRTSFIPVDGTPLQIIAPATAQPLVYHDLQALPPAEQRAAVARLAAEDAGRPFDLQQGPLLRATVLQLGPNEHVLLLALHHLISDGWSLRVLGRELAALYLGFHTHQPPALPPLPVQYADYAIWQRQWVQGSVREQMVAYWRQQLADAPPVLELPTDYPRPDLATYQGASYTFTFPLEYVAAVQTLSHTASVTPFMIYLAVFQVLLARYSGQTDIVVGTPSANRTRAETEGLIGLFLNTLVLRIDLHDQPTFSTLLQRVRDMTLAAFAHQALPFDQVVEAVQPQRDLRYNPLFQVLFMFQNISTPPVELAELTVELLDVDSGTAMLDLTLALMETPTGLYGVVEYNTALFALPTIERLVEHYGLLLEHMTAYPAQSTATIPLLTSAEQAQLAAWNATEAAYPSAACIHTLFEAQVARTPDAVAVVASASRLTYAELNQRANQLAHRLQALGIGRDQPEARVGVCMERSVDLVVALLGALKAGGAYVPLDPAYPADRLDFMLADADAAVLLTQESLAGRLPKGATQALCLDRDWATIAQHPDTNPARSAAPENLAYIIYTSGSTGLPKGVAIEHRSTVALLDWARQVFTPQQLAGVLAATSICFDLSVFELFVPLSVGGTVILAENVLHLSSIAPSPPITLINTVPSALAELLRSGTLPPSIATINLAGEPLSRALVQRAYQQAAVRLVFNLYGPSEDTTYSTFTEVTADDQRPPTIGRPIANTQVYLLDAALQQVPIGVPGELYLSGAGLARGYLSPTITAEQFVPNPFSHPQDTRPGARMYRTGDRARYRADGTLEFLGRRDHQIKLRGFRIELGEIEAALARHPQVREHVVVVRQSGASVSGSADQRLVAYVVPRESRTERQEPGSSSDRSWLPVLGSDLRAFLQATLPDYMVPSIIVVLDELPRLSNGKIDRSALPTPAPLRTEPEHTLVTPRTPTEDVLAGIWATVLGHAPIGVHDQFFELGGHSLLVTQVVSRVRDAFQVELPLRSVFEAPTVAELARRIEAARHTAQQQALPPLRPTSRSEELPLSFAQQRLWFLDQLVPNSPFYNIAAALRLSGQLDAQVLEQALNGIVRRHETLRTTFAQTAAHGRAVQVIAAELPLTLTMIDLRQLAQPEREHEIQRLSAQEAQQPFDLQRGPLIRATLIQSDPAEHVLLITMHHSISDGWSMGIFVQELASFYRALASNDASAAAELLPALPVQYADYAIWQRDWLRGATLATQMDYWKHQLADLPTLDLPTDRPRLPVQSFRGAALRFKLPAPLTEALRTLSRQEGVTLFMLLLAAFKTLLARYSRQDDIAVGTPIAGRTRAEVEGLIGFFVNTLVLRTDLRGDPSFRTLLKRVRETALDAYAHQDLPFEMLVDEVQPQRDMSRNPLFQVLFALQNMPLPPIELPDLTLHSVPADSSTSKFDLWLSLREGPDTLYGTIEYATDLFDSSTVMRMSEHFEQLLAAIVAAPEQRLATLPLIGAAEREQMLVAWNTRYAHALPAPETSVLCLHHLFEAQAKRTPDAVAVIDGTTQVSYAALNHRANQLAHHLQALGVTPETAVGICLERSVDLIAGVLAILKAGGAYVPLDPTYPSERLHFMLADAHAPILVTQQGLLERLPTESLVIICVDTQRDALSCEPVTNPVSAISAEHLAYIIYTSGSTGQPKGVPIAHRSPVNLVTWAQMHYRPAQVAGVLFATSICFDLSIFELFVPLSSGGSVIVAANALQLPELPARQQVTLINTVPSAAAQLLQMDGIPAAVETINLAGEPLPLQLVQQLYAQTTIQHVVNLYGPSETTTYSSWAVMPRDIDRTPPVGRPIAQTQIYLLDDALQPVPIGTVGELFIGGIGLARGYLKQPALTAERFVADPFSAAAHGATGARLYRTGDLARYRADGTIEYLGRIDDQVKLRGFRIELGEVEATLRQHPAVQQAVAMAWEERPGTKRLTAYVVPQPRSDQPDQSTDAPEPDAHVATWQQVFDTTYQQPVLPANDTFDVAGWNSSFTGEPIPAAEMREWVDQTVDRIRALNPRRVLEIGCGTGLLLFRLAPNCVSYRGTDVSQTVLERLQQQVRAQRLTNVTLEQRAAAEMTGLEATFDVVIINSVAQYFPDIDYLLRVLHGALEVLVPGGHLFLGDLRSLPLLPAFHTAVELHNAPAALPIDQLHQHVQRRMVQEQELAVDPALFPALMRRLPRISQVATQLKRGQAHNELTRFRYDVVLRVGGEPDVERSTSWRDWQHEKLSVERLRQLLEATGPERLGLQRVPNIRLATMIQTLQLLNSTPPATVAELRQSLQQLPADHAVDPETLWQLAAALGYTVAIGWSGASADGCFDALLERRRPDHSPARWELAAALTTHSAEAAPHDRPWSSYTNNPLQVRRARQLVPLLRSHLKDRLPEYMLPSAFVLLDTLPLTANGKVDRQALPAPIFLADLEVDLVLPRTPVERKLAEIWTEMLGIDQIGIHHNFFALGGDSILSLQVIARAQQAGLRISPRQMFQHQTIAELAAIVGPTAAGAAEPTSVRGPLPLTLAQRRILAAGAVARVVVLEAPADTNADHLKLAVGDAVRRHDALRLRFRAGVDSWQQFVSEADLPDVFGSIDLAALPPDQQRDALVHAVTEMRASLDPAHGRLLQLRHIHYGADQPSRIVVVAHPMVLDAPALAVVLHDVWTVYEQRSRGAAVVLPPTSMFSQWVQRATSADESLLTGARDYWLDAAPTQFAHIVPDATDREADARRPAPIRLVLSASETQALLHEAPTAYHTQTDDLLLAALVQTLSRDTSGAVLPIEVEGQGRAAGLTGIDLTRAVGCYTTVFPAWLSLSTEGPGATIKAIKEQLRRVPQQGLGYDLLRHLDDPGLVERRQALPQPDVLFVYDGADLPLPPPLRLARETPALAESACGQSSYALDIRAQLRGDQLHLVWCYDPQRYRADVVQQLAETYLSALQALIAHCLSPQSGGFTPSDFPKAKLGQKDLDTLAARLGKPGTRRP